MAQPFIPPPVSEYTFAVGLMLNSFDVDAPIVTLSLLSNRIEPMRMATFSGVVASFSVNDLNVPFFRLNKEC